MNFPVKTFEINGTNGEVIRLEITEVYGFPNETSFRGGYDVKCSLEIACGIYSTKTDCYYSSTGAICEFYNQLKQCYDTLNGKAHYEVYCAENDLIFEVLFDSGKAQVKGKYQDEPMTKNVLHFEFLCDQSYFNETLTDLKKAINLFVI
ncbi:MAG: hypothetical protein HDP34_02980 [Clostridia bacterium]|nr:hypothetical protein [Clostridia bacterium]